MNKLIVIGIIVVSLAVYFTMTVFVLPEKFLEKEQFTPTPLLEAEISNTQINLGESFRLSTISENTGDYGDIHIVSAGFPTLSYTEGIVRIVSYDFSNSPIYIEPGDEIFVLAKPQIKSLQLTKDITQVIYQVAVSAAVVLAL